MKYKTIYRKLEPPKLLWTHEAALLTQTVCELTKKLAINAGKVTSDCAKISGIMPTLFTRSGRLVDPPDLILR